MRALPSSLSKRLPRRARVAALLPVTTALAVAGAMSCGSNGAAPRSSSDGGSPDASDAIGDASLVDAGGGALDGGNGDGGTADAGAPVPNPIVDGPVRFSVISPTLIRAEYAVDDAFTDATTFTAIARPLATSGFTTAVVDGWRQVKTSQVTLAYREGSGRFGARNLTLTLAGNPGATFNPLFRNPLCPAGQVCQAESSSLAGAARLVSNHRNYTGPAFVDDWLPGAAATWNVEGATPGNLSLQIRYANADGSPSTLAWTTTTGGAGTFTLPALPDWDTWGVATAPFTATGAAFGLTVSCNNAQASCAVNVDSVAVTPAGAVYPSTPVSNSLGGWYRGLDGFSGSSVLNQGLLTRDGWYLLDDGQTALWDGTSPVSSGGSLPTARPKVDPDHQDGYVFGYGQSYAQALADFALLAGPPPMLPRYAFGVMFSEYYAYADTDWENTIVPAFRAHTTPLDGIGVDTDWKSPGSWDGWNWSSTYFPDPKAFASWATAQDLHVLLNVHPAIDTDDPQYPTVVATAGPLEDAGPHMEFDLGVQKQVAAFGELNAPLIALGAVPWLDWCCDPVAFSVPGLTPDGWFNQLYASWTLAAGRRGFSLARAGGLLGPAGYPAGNAQLWPTGPWADHRSTVQFTGDTFATWDMLQFEAEFTAAEAAIGMAYVSHDIGSFHADHIDPEELYARWVQLGAFQPVLRLHSDHGDRLPWEYGADVEASAEQFLRLREAMLPYNYSLGWQAHTTGLTMARPLWFVFPDQPDAYTNGSEYMWGDSLLVAPVTVAGTTATTTVWFPPGTWLAFTDAGLPAQSFDGPGSYAVTTTLASMPVFARAGAIVPLQSYTDNATAPAAMLEPRVFGGASGQFTLYEDEGEGLDFQKGKQATTLMTLSGSLFTIGAMAGAFPNAPANRAYQILWSNIDPPAGVSVNGSALGAGDGGSADTWSYDPASRSAMIRVSSRSTTAPLAVQLM